MAPGDVSRVFVLQITGTDAILQSKCLTVALAIRFCRCMHLTGAALYRVDGGTRVTHDDYDLGYSCMLYLNYTELNCPLQATARVIYSVLT